jgi:hypothetical protein
LKLPALPVPAGNLLTIARLQSIKQSQRRALGLVMLSIAWAVLGFALGVIAVGFLWPELLQRIAPRSEGALLVAILIGPVMAAALYAWRISVRCPRCRALISAVSTVIASGNCPHCSGAIVKDAVPQTEYRPLPKLEQVNQAAMRQQWRSLAYLVAGMALAAAAFGIAGAVDRSLADSYPVRVLRVAAYFTASFVTLFPCALLLWRGRLRRYPDLICTHCREPIVDGGVILRCTGNCPNCGQRAIKDA